MQWFSTVVSAFAASTEPDDVQDIRAKWLSVSKYFHLLHGCADAAAYEKYRLQLPDIAAHLTAIIKHLDAEARLAATEGGNRPCVKAVFTAAKSSDSSVFVHACQIAKCGEPPELSAITMHFLVDMLQCVDVRDTAIFDDIHTVARPLMDAVAKLSVTKDPRALEAVARSVALIATWGIAVPELQAMLLPPQLDFTVTATFDRKAANAAFLFDFACRGIQKPTSSAAYCSCVQVLRALLPRLSVTQVTSVAHILEAQTTRCALTLCQMGEECPENMAMLASSLQAVELLCLMSSREIAVALADLNAALRRLMQSQDDSVFSRACSVASACIRHAVTQQTIELLVNTMSEEPTKIRIIANFDNVEAKVAVAAMRLITTLFEFGPVSSAMSFLEMSSASPLTLPFPRGDAISALFSALPVKRTICGDATALLSERAQRQCIATRAVTGSRLQSLGMPATPPLLVKTISAKLKASLDESFDANVATCGLVAALACLPSLAISIRLFGPDGDFTRVLQECKADADRLFAEPSYLQRLYKAIAVSAIPAEKSVGAMISLEYLRQELLGIFEVHVRGDERLDVITE